MTIPRQVGARLYSKKPIDLIANAPSRPVGPIHLTDESRGLIPVF
jgi:hypothetical protein